MSDLSLPPLAHRMIETNGLKLHVVFAGPADGSPVVLLHGFPEFWYGWRHQISPLVEAGYRVIVPDQRGYNRSDKPRGVDAYAIDRPVADAVGLLDALGYEQAQFVGHDWGAGVVWQLALRAPERVARAVTLNVPHPSVFQAFLPGKPSQVYKSWYVFFFQVPRLPERLFGAADWRGLRWFIDTSNRPHTFSEAVLARYREAWNRPGAFTGMLNWYRALLQADVPDPSSPIVDLPMLLLWGTQDPYLHAEMAPRSIEYCTAGRLELLEDATHWLQHEIPDRVNELLLAFLETD